MNNPSSGFFEKNRAIIKAATIFFLILILQIPTSWIMGLIHERGQHRTDAIYEISSKWGGNQTITGPIITVPYRVYYLDEHKNRVFNTHYHHILPELLNAEGDVQTEKKHRGIYEVILYNAKINLKGSFTFGKDVLPRVPLQNIEFEKASVDFGISDLKGIQSNLKLRWNDSWKEFNSSPYTREVIEKGVHTMIDLSEAKINLDLEIPFEISLDLKGSGSLGFVPVGKETNVSLNSPWKSPSSFGSPQPEWKDDKFMEGFSGKWKVIHLARNYPQSWTGNTHSIESSAFGVSLFLPADAYQKSTRSIKYSILFVVLTFLALYMVEILYKTNIHPIQYILVGTGLVLFYSLLISISEHSTFEMAYLISSVMTIALIALYSRSVFKNWTLAGTTGIFLSVLYIFIYVLLNEEEHSLIMGSIGLFSMLALVMFLSRNIDWYSIGIKKKE